MKADWLAKKSELYPDKVAVKDVQTENVWTYCELNTRSMQMAQFLSAQGVKKGDRIALLSPNHVSYFDLLFACAKIGAIFVPLNWRLSTKELTYILNYCTPSFLFYHPEFVKTVESLSISFHVRINVQTSVYTQAFDQPISFAADESVKMNDPFLIIYTGGTTGKPKGAVLSHNSVFWNAINTITSWELDANDVTAVFLPMFHTGGLNALTIPILHIGGTVCISEKFDTASSIDVLVRESCTVVLMVPTMYHMVTTHPLFQHETFPSMKVFISGGAPCPPSIYEAFHAKGLAFKEGYGLTEAGPNNFYMDPREAITRIGSVGKPMLYNELSIRCDDGSEAGNDEVGELWIKGGHLFHSYWKNESATLDAVVDGWLRTGDLAKCDNEGYYYIVGRKKEMIITGGENVYPLEIESCLDQHPHVNEVCVVGLPDAKWGEVVTAFLSLHEDETLSIDELKHYCAEHLGGYKVPKRIYILDGLPKTTVGKMDKQTLIRQFSDLPV